VQNGKVAHWQVTIKVGQTSSRFYESGVCGFVHQGVKFATLGHRNLEEPTLTQWVTIGQSGGHAQCFIDLRDAAIQRHIHIRSGLNRLDNSSHFAFGIALTAAGGAGLALACLCSDHGGLRQD
jgi:hypothetical protein